MPRLTVTITEEQADLLDEITQDGGYESKSAAVRNFIQVGEERRELEEEIATVESESEQLDGAKRAAAILVNGDWGPRTEVRHDFMQWQPTAESPGETVSGSATTMTLLPGGSEHSGDGNREACEDHKDDCNDGGDDLDSSMPDYWGKSLDAWFLADKRESLPEKLEDAVDVTREHPEYPDETFQAYRMKNQIEIEFPTSDGETIDDWDAVDVNLTDQEPSYVLVEGEGSEHGEDNAIRRLINDPPNDDWSWFEGKDKARAMVTRYNQDVVEADDGWEPRSRNVNSVEVNGVEGVRVSVIMDGDDTYITKLNEVLVDKKSATSCWNSRAASRQFPGGSGRRRRCTPSWT